MAVERNLEIVPRSQYGAVMVGEGDRLEIVHFIGGGNAPVETPRTDKPFVIAGKTYNRASSSAPANTKPMPRMRAALEACGAEIVTVAVRRVNLTDPGQPQLIDFIDPKKVHLSAQHGRLLHGRRCGAHACGWRARRAAGRW